MNDHDCDTNLYCYLIILSICFLNSSRTILLLVDIIYIILLQKKENCFQGMVHYYSTNTELTLQSGVSLSPEHTMSYTSFPSPSPSSSSSLSLLLFFLIFQDINISISTLLFWMSRQDFRNARLFLPLYT